MWLVVTTLALVIAGSYRLTSRYVYGPRSSRALALTAVAAFFSALILAAYLFPGVRGGLRLALAAGLSVPLFVAMALVLVEYLGRTKQRVYDEAVTALIRREQACVERVSRLKEIMQDLVQKQRGLEAGGGDRLAESRRLTVLVDRWQQEEGLARVRSLKVHEWQDELDRLDSPALARRRLGLQRELEETALDPERAEAVRVQVALVELRELGLPGEDTAWQMRHLDQKVLELSEERRQLERELADIRASVREWEARRRDFLAKDITLD